MDEAAEHIPSARVSDNLIRTYKLQKLIKMLKESKGIKRCTISFVIPPREQVLGNDMELVGEHETTGDAQSQIIRLSILDAIVSAQEKLQLCSEVPDNGLFIYWGSITPDKGSGSKIKIDMAPFKVNNTSPLYVSFRKDILLSLLMDRDKYGFIILDDKGTLFGMVQGNMRETRLKFVVHLPKKQCRTFRPALRLSVLRDKKRLTYLRKVAEMAKYLFATDDKVTMKGTIPTGSASFNAEHGRAQLFYQRVSSRIIKPARMSYGGGSSGLIQTSVQELRSSLSAKIEKEKQLIKRYFKEIDKGAGKCCFSVEEAVKALESDAVETLICWEDIKIQRYVVKQHDTDETRVIYMTAEQQAACLNDREVYDITEAEPLLKWLKENYKNYGATLEIITDRTPEGSRFVKEFGGFGALLYHEDNSGMNGN